MRSFVSIFLLLAFLSSYSELVAETRPQRIKKLEKQVTGLKTEILELSSSVESLSSLSERLKQESEKAEQDFKSRLSRVIVHLIQWPERRWGGSATSWSELQRLNMVLEDVRQALVKSPLEMMANRELRVSEVEHLTQELSTQMFELESKQSLLDVQLEELRNLERRLTKKVPQASGRTKKMPKTEAME